MSTPSTAAFRPAIIYFLGGWDLGICGDLILQGVVFAQVAHYIGLYHKDGLALRAFVAVLLLITTLKSAQGLVILWIQNVDNFMDINAALSMFTTSWTTEINLAFIALIVFYVQLFFCVRLWWISRNLYIVAVIVTLLGFAFIAAIVSCVFTFAGQSKTSVTWINIQLGTIFAGDLLLCGSTIYFLLSQSKSVSSQTAGVLNALTKLSFQSAAPAVVCALINLVTTLAWNGTVPNAYIMLSLISNIVLPKLYAISAMWTLNSRKDIRRAHSIGPKSSTATSGPRPPHSFELSSAWVVNNQSDLIEMQKPNTTPLDDLNTP
ncbi:hypothetical protein B0H19DRAFT_1147993 [Mycena capillaripes]|nr:hypothetical protein B0H19DRAFT_1147993 [Mycena capillaripes]